MSIELIGLLAAQVVFLIGLINGRRSKTRESEIAHFDYWFSERVMELLKALNEASDLYEKLHPKDKSTKINLSKVNQLESLIERTYAEYYQVVVDRKLALPDIFFDRYDHDTTGVQRQNIKKLTAELSDGVRIKSDPRKIQQCVINLEDEIREFTKIIRRRLIECKGLFRFYIFRRVDYSLEAIKIH